MNKLDKLIEAAAVDNLYLSKVGDIWYAEYVLYDTRDSNTFEGQGATPSAAIEEMLERVQ